MDDTPIEILPEQLDVSPTRLLLLCNNFLYNSKDAEILNFPTKNAFNIGDKIKDFTDEDDNNIHISKNSNNKIYFLKNIGYSDDDLIRKYGRDKENQRKKISRIFHSIDFNFSFKELDNFYQFLLKDRDSGELKIHLALELELSSK